jgi:UDPglucose 6-dehydrogenase
VITTAIANNRDATIIVKLTIPVGVADDVRAPVGTDQVIFDPKFPRESRVLHDNLCPST